MVSEQAAMWWVAHEILLSALGLFRFSILDSRSPSPSRLTIRFIISTINPKRQTYGH